MLDALRGLIMAFMAIDHASLFVAGRHFTEYWGVAPPDYGDIAWMLTRVISHLCAPGFFFLMGVGMHFFFASRSARGMSDAAIRRHFVVRGALLVLIDIFIVTPTWVLGSFDKIMSGSRPPIPVPGAVESVYFVWGVLAALGVGMVMAGFLVRLSAWTTLGLGVALGVVSQWIVPDATRAAEPLGYAMRFLFVAGQEGPAVINYPVLPWFSVCLLGIAYGHAVRSAPERTLRLSGVAGVSALVAFALVRSLEAFGTHHPIPGEGIVAFLTVTKYPPSLAYLLLALGSNAVFLWLILAGRHLLEGPAKALLVFGRAPLFYYVVHLYLFALVGKGLPGDTSLAGMYLVVLIGLAILYPACVRYDVFKRAKAEDSIWRMF